MPFVFNCKRPTLGWCIYRTLTKAKIEPEEVFIVKKSKNLFNNLFVPSSFAPFCYFIITHSLTHSLTHSHTKSSLPSSLSLFFFTFTFLLQIYSFHHHQYNCYFIQHHHMLLIVVQMILRTYKRRSKWTRLKLKRKHSKPHLQLLFVKLKIRLKSAFCECIRFCFAFECD